MKTTLSFLAAILLPACLMTVWYLHGQFEIFKPDDPYIWVRTKGFLLACLAVSAAHVVLLGTPTYFFLRKLNKIRWWSTIASGFVLGAIPMAVFIWPLQHTNLKTSATVNGIQTMIDGIPTLAGWLQYAEGVGFLGGLGAVGGLAFWLSWRLGPQQGAPGDAPKAARP